MRYNLKIRNFQSLKDMDIAINGVTIIHSKKSDIGKSSFVRALGALLFGFNIKDAIRHGANKMYVGLKWEDHSIEWIKAKGINDYKIDGESYHSVGAGVPPAIEKLGFYKLVFGDMQIVAQIRKQFDKAWPLILNAPDLGKVVGSLVQTDNIYKAVKELLSDSGRLRSRINKCGVEIDVKGKEIDKLYDLDIVNTALRKIDIEGYTKEADKIEQAEKHMRDIAAATLTIQSLHEISKIKMPDKGELIKSLDTITAIDRLTENAKQLDRLSDIPSLPDKGELIKNLSIITAIDRFTELKTKLDRLSDIPSTPDKDKEIIEKICRMVALLHDIESTDEALKTVDSSIVELKEEIEETGIEICETCGGTGVRTKDHTCNQ